MVLRFADSAGAVLYALDARGRKVGRQNLDVFFGDAKGAEEKRGS